MGWAGRICCALAAATSAQAPAAAQSLLFAGGNWAALDRGRACEAASLSLHSASRERRQGVAGFAFDRGGPRNGQFFAFLSRPAREGASVIVTVGTTPFLLVARGDWAWSRNARQEKAMLAAAREARSMQVVAHDSRGRRFVDRYALQGVATALDAAAAQCSTTRRSSSLEKSRIND